MEMTETLPQGIFGKKDRYYYFLINPAVQSRNQKPAPGRHGRFCCVTGVIGQKELVKTAVSVGIPIAAAVLSCFQEDTGRTKRVGKKPVKH